MVPVARGLLTALQTSLALSDTKAAQSGHIFRGVIAPAARSSAGHRQRSEPLAEPEPARAYAELAGSLANRECTLLLKHAPTLKLADKFV
jgi:hypothetical protein